MQNQSARVTAEQGFCCRELGLFFRIQRECSCQTRIVGQLIKFGGLVEQSITLGDTLGTVGGAFEDVLRSLQGGVERGTDEYKKLEIAVQATNIVQAIGAILNQAQGDPYTAVPRMAAMASIVASLIGTVFSISGMSGGMDDPTAERQARLGTGSVFGDDDAQSESIKNSLDIVADATSELVGINRGMLRALRSLDEAIGGASQLLVQGLGNLDFGELPGTEGLLGSLGLPEPVFGFLNDFLGGSVSIADTGISIEGGKIADLLENVVVTAFQDLAVQKNIFSSTNMERRTEELDQAINDQFTQIFRSLVDTVTEAALVLGFTQDEIQARLDDFEMWSADISFEDMNAEEREAALQAYFSNVFDSIAHTVVPMLSSLIKVGEGAGEALVRAATSVQVFDYAIEQLGFSFWELSDFGGNFEAFRYQTILSKVALVELVGGIEEFVEKTTEFIDAFFTEEQKFDMMLSSIQARFSDLGLTLPNSREGLLNLMEAQDASTEAGQQAIAMLLELTPLLDEYYNAIEAGEQRRAQQLQTVRQFLDVGPSDALVGLRNSFVEAMEAAKALNASQREYALIMRSFERQMERFTAQLTVNVIRQSQALFGEAAEEVAGGFEDGFENVRRVSNSLFGEWQRALTSIREYADGLLLDENLTTLNPRERLNEARSQFDDILAAARAGDVNAAADLPRAAQAFLEEARFMFASGDQYQAIFNEVQQALRGIEMPPGIEEYTIEIASNTSRTADAVEAMQNETADRLDRLIQAMDLAATLRDLGFALEQSPVDIANELGVPLDQLAEALGLNLDDVSRETVLGIINMAERLGADVHALGDSFGFDIEALAAKFSVDLRAFDFDSKFLTQEDWLSKINEQLEMVNSFLRNGSTLAPPTNVQDPGPSELGGPGGRVKDPAPTLTGSGDSETLREELAEVRLLLAQIRDDNANYHNVSEGQGVQIIQTNTEVADSIRRTA